MGHEVAWNAASVTVEGCVRGSVTGGRGQGPGEITYSHGDFFFFHPLSSDGNEVVHRQATQQGAWSKMA